MPIILNILGNIPEELLQLADEKRLPVFNKLPQIYQDTLQELNNQLIELYATIIAHFPQYKGDISTLLAEAMSAPEYDQFNQLIPKLYATNWIANTKSASSLHLLNIAFMKRTLIKKNQELPLAAEKARLEIDLDLKTEQHRIKIDKEIADIDQMIAASNILKKSMNLTQLFANITEDLLKEASKKPSPKLDQLTPEQQTTLNILGAELAKLIQRVPGLVKIVVDADSLMMIIADSISSPEFDPLHRKIEKLFETRWLGQGIGIEYAALTSLFTSFMLRNAIQQNTQNSLSEEKMQLNNKLQQPEKSNAKIKSLHASLIKIQDIIEIASLVQKMEVLPSTLKSQPQDKIISRFEEKLKMKIISLDKNIQKKNSDEKNYEAFTINKHAKIAHLKAMLKQITLYRFNAITLDDFIERVQLFKEAAEHLLHTSSFKIFVNKHIDDGFTVDTKKILDEFHEEIAIYKSGLSPKK
jgi:hypothetical protein